MKISETESILLKIVQDRIGTNLSDGTILALMHIVHGYEIYLSDASPSDPEGYPIELTQRAAANFALSLEGRSQAGAHDYVQWMTRFRDAFGGNWYQTPSEYEPLVSELLEKLRQHPWVDRIIV
ncbi:MAG: hypothetical protein ABI700_19680 [Chloroflexota bacterium]